MEIFWGRKKTAYYIYSENPETTMRGYQIQPRKWMGSKFKKDVRMMMKTKLPRVHEDGESTTDRIYEANVFFSPLGIKSTGLLLLNYANLGG